MKIQKRELIPFLTPDKVNEGDFIVIESEGELVDTPGGAKRYRFLVSKNGEKYLWTMNNTTVNRLVDAFGDETQNWIGKKVKIQKVLVLVRNQEKLSLVGMPCVEKAKKG